MVGARLGLNSLLREQLTALGKPGPRGANMVAQFRTAEGAITHVLTNTLSSSLVWAFRSTTEDDTIRAALYAKPGRVCTGHYKCLRRDIQEARNPKLSVADSSARTAA